MPVSSTLMPPSPSPVSRLPHAIAWLFETRWGNLATFVACAGMLAFGYYLQFAQGIQPCPLCMLQRLAFLITGVVSLVAALHHPDRIGARVYGAIIALAALAGAAVAARHVWLQHTPANERPACGPGLDYLLSTFGPLESFSRILRGSGECGVVDWTLLGFSIPELTLPSFIFFAAWASFLALRR